MGRLEARDAVEKDFNLRAEKAIEEEESMTEE